MVKNRGNFSGNARYEGFCIDLLKEIAHMVGFGYKIELVPDGKYGVYNYETGEWNGIVRQLMDKVSVSILETSQFRAEFNMKVGPRIRRTSVEEEHEKRGYTSLRKYSRIQKLSEISVPIDEDTKGSRI